MDLETISNVNSNYGSAEAVKASAPKAEERVETVSASRVVTESVPVTPQPMPVDARDAEQQGSGQQQKQKHTPSESTVNEAVKRANLKMEHTRCEYSYHKRTNRVSIKVIDRDTDEVIREIPPEKSLDMLQKMWELAGILVDEKR